ncbi:DUF6177 family protein [Streptomonospora wellingtoniae]|uniref:DUF6177 family protein n=1 Tax=Streptomonospora wellingtoniae TaxID=3075544 RepID=A0ABU2KYW0_9ACTN|nr:DUF6177 family protein [Streptomonospora sp. DSM 45055]MDT0304208.1 DUF6177 family protein [Streptomonospora sp. DSM 45055]
MTHDVVALLDRRPTMRGMTRALVQAGRALRVRTVADGAVVELRDDSGRPVAAAQAGQRLATSHEAERLLGSGVGDSLPAQPWWVEARGAETEAGVPDTAGMVRRFADSLAAEFGGRVWQAEPRLDRDEPLLTGTTDHPAVTRATDRVAIAVQDRPVVPLSTWLADAVAAHGRAGRGFQLLTPAQTRLTNELAALLENPMARWVVRAHEGDYYDGHVGLPLTWHEKAGFIVDASKPADLAPHPHYLGDGAEAGQDAADHPAEHLLVDLDVLHAADHDLRLGAEVELLTRTCAGSAPALWGTAEPAPMVWNRDDVTALARRRAPDNSRFVVLGPPDAARPISGTLSVSRVDEGVKESITLAVAHPPGVLPDLDAVTGLVEELAVEGELKAVRVQRRRGLGDLTRAPHDGGPCLPVGLGLGPDTVRTIGLPHARSAPVEPIELGPRFAPALWYPLGDGTVPEDRERLDELMAHLRPGETATARA